MISIHKMATIMNGGNNMTSKQIFTEWTTTLPHKRKAQVAQELLLISKCNDLTFDEQKKIEEAKKFLLQCD